MTDGPMALQTERFYPQLATGRPILDTAGRHAWTGVLAAGCTASGLCAALCAVGTITALGSTNLPTQLAWTPVLATATIHLTRYTAWLARTIRRRV